LSITQWQAEQQRIQEEANRKRAEAARKRERTEKGTFQAKTEPVRPQLVDGLAKKVSTKRARFSSQSYSLED